MDEGLEAVKYLMLILEMDDQAAAWQVQAAEQRVGRSFSSLMIGAEHRLVGVAQGDNLSHLEDVLHQALVPARLLRDEPAPEDRP